MFGKDHPTYIKRAFCFAVSWTLPRSPRRRASPLSSSALIHDNSPPFHYLLWQDVAAEYASADTHCTPYEAVNVAFAKCVAEVYWPGDLIWIHDYHLLLVPSLLRQTLPDAAVGLFVHTPFPSSEVFRCLPRRKEILDGMPSANLICFPDVLLLAALHVLVHPRVRVRGHVAGRH